MSNIITKENNATNGEVKIGDIIILSATGEDKEYTVSKIEESKTGKSVKLYCTSLYSSGAVCMTNGFVRKNTLFHGGC